jgi:hypothetical protein
LIAIRLVKARSDEDQDVAMAEEILEAYRDSGDMDMALSLLEGYDSSSIFYDAMWEAETDMVPSLTLYSTLIIPSVWPTLFLGGLIGYIQFAASRKK